MKCPICGEMNEAGYRFCRICGSALAAPSPEEGRAAAAATGKRPAHVEAPTPPEPPEPAPSYKLAATAGLLSGRTFSIGPKGLVIGRDPGNCQVVIADEEISRLHAWVGFNDRGQVMARDCQSVNGTYVNRTRIHEQLLQPADELAIGGTFRHLFRTESVAAPRAPKPRKAVTPRPATATGETSILSAGELARVPGAEKADETVALKLTDLVAQAHLELIVDKYAVRTLEIPPQGLTVGRDSETCQLVFDHPSVSAVHAEFTPLDGKTILVDHSTNGTFVDGRRITVAELHDGEYITFGRYAGKSLIFRAGLEPQLKSEVVDLTRDRITIGRDPSNDICINHPLVSKQHAELVKQEGKTFLVDLGSTNGTFVNGIKIRRHQLHETDRIVIGPSELHFTGESVSRAADTNVVRLDASGVSLEVPDRTTGAPKLLLDDISLVVKPRELIGLLGPSGAGKTTLMRALNGFVKPTRGQVLYSGVDLYQNLDSLKSTIGFVPQEDIMHRQLSVRRCLYYAAKLRLPEDLSDQELDRRVEEMLDILKIEPKLWDNPVATLSGGQRKRVSIGIELLPKPGVLFLDEPTAGLDPRTETLMMMLFRQIANQGSTIVITTHLLASFGVLDKVLVLVQGRLTFYGPGSKLLDYFHAETPPDIYDDLTDNNTAPYAVELKKRFADSALYQQVIAEPLKTTAAAAVPVPAAPAPTAPAPSAPAAAPAETQARKLSLHQFKVLVRRNWDLKFGDRAQTLLLFLEAPLVALLVCWMSDEPNQIQTIFMAMFAALWFGCSNAVREIVDEQSIYRHERQTGLKIPSYIGSKLAVLSLIDLAQCASVVIILLLVKHALVLSPAEVLAALVIMFLVAVNGSLIGLLISSLVNSPEKALALFPLVLIPELLLSGMFLPVRRIQPIMPITVEDLFAGEMYAQPEAKDRARQMVNPPQPNTPPPAAAPQAGRKRSRLGQQVVAAVAPTPKVEKTMHQYMPASQEGMGPVVKALSFVAVSRWGFEALADLCIHGAHSTDYSAYKIINTVAISLHPNDVAKLEKGLEAPAAAYTGAEMFPLPSHFWRDKGPYLAILIAFIAAMTAAILFQMERKDVA